MHKRTTHFFVIENDAVEITEFPFDELDGGYVKIILSGPVLPRASKCNGIDQLVLSTERGIEVIIHFDSGFLEALKMEVYK